MLHIYTHGKSPVVFDKMHATRGSVFFRVLYIFGRHLYAGSISALLYLVHRQISYKSRSALRLLVTLGQVARVYPEATFHVLLTPNNWALPARVCVAILVRRVRTMGCFPYRFFPPFFASSQLAADLILLLAGTQALFKFLAKAKMSNDT
jgi:hypothetical protein